MDKINDINMKNNENPDTTNEIRKDYSELSTLINYQGNFLKESQSKIAEISNFVKKFKILDDPHYYQSNKEYSNLMKSTKMRLEKIIFQTLLFADENLRIEDFKMKE